MMTIGEAAKRSGVSVRTLRHYDAAGLLRPTTITEAGYRLYDEAALARLQQILMYRELEFSLKDIRRILDSPEYDRTEALRQQIDLLQLRRAHIDGLLKLAFEMMKNGGLNEMSFSAFDREKMNEYAKQAKARWGDTDAFREFAQKDAGRGDAAREAAGAGLMDIFADFGAIRDGDPKGEAAQALVARLRAYISEHFYSCTAPVLASLGGMYAAEGEMRDNIDRTGGSGTARFAADAIAAYCKMSS